MKETKKQLLFNNQAQVQLLDSKEIIYDRTLVDVKINSLLRPNYSSRKLVANQIKGLKTLLNTFGFLGGIFIEAKSKHVIDGWHRLEEWQRLGHTYIPSYIVDCSPNQERALHLGLNQQSATWNPSNLDIYYKDFDLLEDFGIDLTDLLIQSKPTGNKFTGKEKNNPEGFAKLTTTLPVEYYDRLVKIKGNMQAPSMAAAVSNLIKFYDESN